MNKLNLKIKLAFITGLQQIVVDEVSRYPDMRILSKEIDCLYLDLSQNYLNALGLKSISRAFVVVQDSLYNPTYISKHKSIIGELVNMVISTDKKNFKSFKITCAGSDSPEVRSIVRYIQEEYDFVEKEEADIKIHIIKPDDVWEVGVQLTARPLSLRDYKVRHMNGAMDPTIAYAMNSLCELEHKESYLNAFSGSATLLIEAGQNFPNLIKLIGFDNTKEHISLAMQNIKKSGLIKRIQIYEKDIFDKPDLGKFDCIVADLPFGMAISKNENLEDVYQCFIEYSEDNLNSDGVLAVYTSEHELLEKLLKKSRFNVTETIQLKFITSVNAYLRPKIFICKLK
jgi:23S rRNA G2445 N2-methylase RlmL